MTDRKYVWSGWLLLMELDGLNSDAVVRKYAWGLDLAGQSGGSASGRSGGGSASGQSRGASASGRSGVASASGRSRGASASGLQWVASASGRSMEGAGGTLDEVRVRQGQVSGLLAKPRTLWDRPLAGQSTPGTSDDRTFVYYYDATLDTVPRRQGQALDTAQRRQGQAGNVGQLVETTAGGDYGTLAVKYEYDPYGNRLGDPAYGEYHQPFRFSTKQFDDEVTELYYFGYRYYSPGLGRWISRDPIGESGGLALYAHVNNHLPNAYDALGLQEGGLQRGSLEYSCDREWSVNGDVSDLGFFDSEANEVAWFLRYVLRGLNSKTSESDTFRLSDSFGAAIFESTETFQADLDNMVTNALLAAKKLQCVPGNGASRVKGIWQKTYTGGSTSGTTWNRYVNAITYIIQGYRWKANVNCDLQKLCWCCNGGQAGYEVSVSCEIRLDGSDRYDFHGFIGPSIGRPFGLEWRYLLNVETCEGKSCENGQRRPGTTGSW